MFQFVNKSKHTRDAHRNVIDVLFSNKLLDQTQKILLSIQYEV